MSGYLVDTHALLWWAQSPNRLSSEAQLTMSAGRNQLFVSHATLWEMSIKISRGRLKLPESPDMMMKRARCHPLPISIDHIQEIPTLPQHHRDPFDRMIVAQATCNNLVVITNNQQMQLYDIQTLAA